MRFFTLPALVRMISPSQVIWRINTSCKKIFLTFDDGPDPAVTPQILSVLDEFNAKATFFCLGKNAAKHPLLLDEIISRGHSVGNHSYNHYDAWRTSSSVYLQDVDKAGKIIKSAMFRPPYGRLPLRRFQEIAQQYQIIMWTIMSYDFDPHLTAREILDRFEKQGDLSGAIIVFHDNCNASKLCLKVLPVLLENKIKNGYSFENL
jgi:peptidoglycan-N-acetylglucosamine deacetylase